jgi:hypothetical protein
MHPERLILRIRSEACTAEPTNREVDMGSRHEAQRLNGEQFCIMK